MDVISIKGMICFDSSIGGSMLIATSSKRGFGQWIVCVMIWDYAAIFFDTRSHYPRRLPISSSMLARVTGPDKSHPGAAAVKRKSQRRELSNTGQNLEDFGLGDID